MIAREAVWQHRPLNEYCASGQFGSVYQVDWMRTLAKAIAVVAYVLVVLGVAATVEAHARVRAPIGHHQPEADQLPPQVRRAEGARTAKQKKFDRSVESICRGCKKVSH